MNRAVAPNRGENAGKPLIPARGRGPAACAGARPGFPRDDSETVRGTGGSRPSPSRSPPPNPGVTIARCSPGGLEHFRGLPKQAGVHAALFGLRHLVATSQRGLSLWAVSRTARHSTLSTTANVYAHVPQRTADQAVDAIAAALDQDDRSAATSRSPGRTSHEHVP